MGSKQSSQSNTAQTYTPPANVMAQYNAVTSQAQNIASTPYQPYTGQLVAPVNSQQNTGIDATNNASGIQDSYNTGATGLTAASAGAITPATINAADIQQYESPYNTDVVNATEAELQNQNLQQQTALQGNAISAGAFGGDRAGIAQAALAGQQDLASDQTIASLNNQNYQQALTEANTQQATGLSAAQNTAARQLAAGSQLGTLGNTAQTEALTEANAQVNAGTLEQQTQQAEDTANYNQYLQAQAYPFEVEGWLANIVEGIGSQSGGTTTGQTTTDTSALSSILGGAAGLGSLLLPGKKSGGHIVHRAVGGGLGGAITPYAATTGVFDPTASQPANTGVGGGTWVPAGPLSGGHSNMPTGLNPAGGGQQAQTPLQSAQTMAATAKGFQGLGTGISNGFTALAPDSVNDAIQDAGDFARGGVPHRGIGGLVSPGAIRPQMAPRSTGLMPASMAAQHFAGGGLVVGDGGLMRRPHYDDGGDVSPADALMADADATAPTPSATLSPKVAAINDLVFNPNSDAVPLVNPVFQGPTPNPTPVNTGVDAAGQAAVKRLSQGAEALNSRIPGAVDPDVSGAQLRHAVGTVGDEVRQAKNRLFDAVDPDGKLAVVTSQAASAAKDLLKKIDPSVSIPSPHAMPVLSMVANLPEVTPFKKLISLDQTISSKMSEAARAGDTVGHFDLMQLKGIVKSAINDAIDNQHAWEQGAVSRGELSPEDTFVARMIRERDDILASQRAGQAARTSNGRSQPSGDSFFPSRAGEKVSDIGRHGSTPSNQRISPPELQPNIDDGAAQRIKAANAAHANYAQTYKQGPVGEALKTNGFAGQYTTPNSAIVSKAFPSGDKGYEAVKAFTKAGKTSHDTVGALQDMAVTRLREIMKGQDRVSPHTLETWKQRYGQALRAIDEVSPGFSRQFDDAARASDIVGRAQIAHADQVAEAKRGAVAPFLKATHPDEVKANVGKLLAATNGPTQIKALLGRMGSDTDAIDGLRRAGVEHLLDKFSTAATAGGERVISGAELGDFLGKHVSALEALYGKDGLKNMRLVAADQARFQRAADAVKAKGGSDTGQNVIPFLKKMVESGHSPSIGAVALMEGIDALHEGSPEKAVLIGSGVALKGLVGKKIAAGNEKINKLYLDGLLDPDVGSAMLRRAFERNGTPNKGAWNALSGALARSLYRTRAAFPAINKDQNEN